MLTVVWLAVTDRLSRRGRGRDGQDGGLATGAERVELITAVDEYVFGYAEGEEGLSSPDLADWESKWGDYMVSVGEYLEMEMEAGDFPNVEEFMEGEDFITVIRRMIAEYADDERFDRGLQRLLDGIEAEIRRES